MNFKRKRSIGIYSGSFCMLSMITAVSLYANGSKQANAILPGIGPKTSAAIQKVASSLTTGVGGLKVYPDPEDPSKHILGLKNPAGNLHIYLGQNTPKSKVLLLGNSEVKTQDYVGRGGSTKKIILQTTDGLPFRTSSSGLGTPTSTKSLVYTSSGGQN